MAESEFVEPDVVRINLSNNRWIEVKKELNAGETRRLFSNLVKTMRAGERVELDPNQVGKTKLLEYIVGWSFVDKQGVSVPFSEAALDQLKPKVYRELVDAVDAHEAQIERELEEKKSSPVTSSR